MKWAYLEIDQDRQVSQPLFILVSPDGKNCNAKDDFLNVSESF